MGEEGVTKGWKLFAGKLGEVVQDLPGRESVAFASIQRRAEGADSGPVAPRRLWSMSARRAPCMPT
jgi:hypothetical protein